MQGHGEFGLSKTGIHQAEKLAQRLLTDGHLPTHVYSSPLQRAAQTTQILLDHIVVSRLPAAVSDLIDQDGVASMDAPEDGGSPLSVEYADELKEFQNGIFQGLTWAEAIHSYPELCHTLELSPDWIPIPGAESLQDARSRSQQFIQKVLQRHRNGDLVWIVTHSWILQHLIAELMGCDRSWRMHANNTGIFEFWIDHSRWLMADQNRFNTDLWQVRRFNDCHHLHNDCHHLHVETHP